MNDSMARYVLLLAKWIDRIILLILIIIGALVITQSLFETVPSPYDSTTAEKYLPPEELPHQEYERVVSYMDAESEIFQAKEGRYLLIKQFNPFKSGDIEDDAEIEQKVQRLMREIRTKFAKKDYERCIDLCEEVMRYGGRPEAEDLYRKCKKALEAK